MHCDSIIMSKPSVHEHTGAHNFMDHGTKYALVALFKRRVEIRPILVDLCKHLRSSFKRTDGSPAFMRKLRWDGAPEFGNATAVADIARMPECGFDWQTTEAYDAKQNEDIERFNCTIKNITRSIMLASGLDDSFWSFAAIYACRIYSRVGHSALNGLTPFHRAHGYPSDNSDMAVFGCKAWAHVPKPKRNGAWSVKAVPGIFLGFSTKTNGYVIWDPKQPKKFLDGVHCWFDMTEHGQDALEECVARMNNQNKYYVLRPSARKTTADTQPLENLAEVAGKAINFVKHHIHDCVFRQRPVNIPQLVAEFMAEHHANLVPQEAEATSAPVEVDFEKELKDRQGLPDLPVTVVVQDGNAHTKAGQPAKPAEARQSAGEAIEVEYDGEWEDCMLVEQLTPQSALQQGHTDSELAVAKSNSTQWAVAYEMQDGQVATKNIDLAQQVFKWLPYVPKFVRKIHREGMPPGSMQPEPADPKQCRNTEPPSKSRTQKRKASTLPDSSKPSKTTHSKAKYGFTAREEQSDLHTNLDTVGQSKK